MVDNGSIQVDVKGRNLEVTEALRQYAEKKASKLAKFFDNGELDTEVLLSLQRGMQIAELTLRVGGLVLRGESRTNDMYASIDEACDRIEQQIRKYKTRIQRRLQDVPRKAALRVQHMDDSHEAAAPHIVRSKRFPMKPMDVEEAVTEMELVGHDFFVFRNAATEQINVVYRRRDGDYGLIEPEF
jgi:putative sigma-54 modulation protein